MQTSQLIPAVAGIVVSFSTGIVVDKIADQVFPADMKAVPAFGIKLGVAVAGWLISQRVAKVVTDNLEAVVATLKPEESEEVTSEKEEN